MLQDVLSAIVSSFASLAASGLSVLLIAYLGYHWQAKTGNTDVQRTLVDEQDKTITALQGHMEVLNATIADLRQAASELQSSLIRKDGELRASAAKIAELTARIAELTARIAGLVAQAPLKEQGYAPS